MSSLAEYDNQRHPHLVEVTQALAWKALGYPSIRNTDAMILLSNAFFLAILLFSTYGIGCILYNKYAAFLAALLVSFFPIVFGHSRMAMLDLPLAAMVSLSAYALLKTDSFRSPSHSILFGIASGFAQLTKETAFVFISGPFLYYAYRSFLLQRHKRLLLHVLLAMSFAVLAAATVYLRPSNFHAFQRYIEVAQVRTYPDQLYYLKRASLLIGPLLGVVLLPLLLACLTSLKERNKFLFLWFLVPLLIYSLSPSKTVRQFVPLLPALAVMLSGEVWIHRWFKRARASYVFLMVSFAILQYAFVNAAIFHEGYYRQELTMDTGVLRAQRTPYALIAESLTGIFRHDIGAARQDKQVCFLFHYPAVYDSLRLAASFDALPLEIVCPLEGDERAFRRDYGDLTQMDWSRVIIAADYIVEKTGVTCGSPGPDERIISRGLEASFAQHRNEFVRIAELAFGNGDLVFVYKKSGAAGLSARLDGPGVKRR
ncbi:MAG TPA: glycosyltransferase family 39 protein [Patescibacteria group bacterium]|nr:glycosyltransferase family 39 protein [Patescibacteria group bacterium]